MPNEFNKHDKQAFARFYPRRMSAEVLFDAVNQVTNAKANFGGLPTDKYAPNRAIMLPDESFPADLLDVLGRPQRIVLLANASGSPTRTSPRRCRC